MDPDTARLRPGLRDRARQLRPVATPIMRTHELETTGDGTASAPRRVIIGDAPRKRRAA
jgi:hypothetical protein